jgi:hypothetical protein
MALPRYTGTVVGFIPPSVGSGTGPTANDSFYFHNQITPAGVWVITHNLNKFPSVTVVDSALSVVIGEVRYIDENTVELTFSGAFSGRAYIN